MKKATMITLAMLVAFAGLTAIAQESSEVVTVPYVTDFAEAKALAADGDKPIVIDFYTDWCVWCKKFDKDVATQKNVIDYFTDEAVFAKINAEEDTLVANEFKVMGYPTFVLTNSKGEEIDRIAGYLEADEFLQTLDDYQNGIGTMDALLAEAEGSEDRELFFKIADKYKFSGLTTEAKVWFDKISANSTDSLAGEAYMAVADMYRREDKDEEAMEVYKQVVKVFEGTDFEPRGMLYVGHMHRWAKEYETAMNIYNTVMTRFKGGEFEELGEIYRAINFRDKGDTAQAISSFAEFTKHWPNSEDVAYANEQIAKLRGE